MPILLAPNMSIKFKWKIYHMHLLCYTRINLKTKSNWRCWMHFAMVYGYIFVQRNDTLSMIEIAKTENRCLKYMYVDIEWMWGNVWVHKCVIFCIARTQSHTRRVHSNCVHSHHIWFWVCVQIVGAFIQLNGVHSNVFAHIHLMEENWAHSKALNKKWMSKKDFLYRNSWKINQLKAMQSIKMNTKFDVCVRVWRAQHDWKNKLSHWNKWIGHSQMIKSQLQHYLFQTEKKNTTRIVLKKKSTTRKLTQYILHHRM